MKQYTTVTKSSGDLEITIPKEFVSKLGLVDGTEACIKLNTDGSLKVDFLTEEISLDLTDEEISFLSQQAHLENKTLNEYMNCLLENAIENFDKHPDASRDIVSRVKI